MQAGDNIITFYYAKKATGIIPQAGINTLTYIAFSIALIVVVNTGIYVYFRRKN